MENERKTGSSVVGMVNNLRYSSDKLNGAAEAKFLLKELSAVTGESQQSILVSCINYAARNIPRYRRHYQDLKEAYDKQPGRNSDNRA